MIADYRKRSVRLGTTWKYVPIEVLPVAYVPVKLKIEVGDLPILTSWPLSSRRYFVRIILGVAETESVDLRDF